MSSVGGSAAIAVLVTCFLHKADKITSNLHSQKQYLQTVALIIWSILAEKACSSTMRLLLRPRDPDLIHNNQYLQRYSDTCEQSNERSMTFLFPDSTTKTSPPMHSTVQGKVRKCSFHSCPCMCIPAASLPSIPKKFFTRWPVHCLSSSYGCRERGIKPDVLDLFTGNLIA